MSVGAPLGAKAISRQDSVATGVAPTRRCDGLRVDRDGATTPYRSSKPAADVGRSAPARESNLAAHSVATGVAPTRRCVGLRVIVAKRQRRHGDRSPQRMSVGAPLGAKAISRQDSVATGVAPTRRCDGLRVDRDGATTPYRSSKPAADVGRSAPARESNLAAHSVATGVAPTRRCVGLRVIVAKRQRRHGHRSPQRMSTEAPPSWHYRLIGGYTPSLPSSSIAMTSASSRPRLAG